MSRGFTGEGADYLLKSSGLFGSDKWKGASRWGDLGKGFGPSAQDRFYFSSAAAAAKSLQPCPTLCWPHRWQPTRLPHPWDSPGKNTGVGCHCLLRYFSSPAGKWACVLEWVHLSEIHWNAQRVKAIQFFVQQ